MLVLALDTSTPAVSVALADADGPLAEWNGPPGNRHAELLMPAVAELLGRCGRVPGDIGAVAAGRGPGPFTGLRIGLVTAAAVAHAVGVPLYTVCSLDVLASRHVGEEEFAAVTDARRREVYWARYSADGCRLAGPAVARPGAVAQLLSAAGVYRVVGAGALAYAEQFGGLTLDAGDPYPSAGALAELVREKVRARAPADSVQPLYLRAPDASPVVRQTANLQP